MKNKCVLAFFVILSVIIALAIFKKATAVGDIPAHVSSQEIEEAVIHYTEYLKANEVGHYSAYLNRIGTDEKDQLVKDVVAVISANNTKNTLLPHINNEFESYEKSLLDLSKKRILSLQQYNQPSDAANKLHRLDAKLHILGSYYNNYFKEQQTWKLHPDAEAALNRLLSDESN